MQLALLALLPFLASLSQAIPVPRHLYALNFEKPDTSALDQHDLAASSSGVSEYSPLNITMDGRRRSAPPAADMPTLPIFEVSKGDVLSGVGVVEKMTNAQRLAQGLGPMPPTRRSIFVQRSRTSQTSMQPNERTGVIRVIRAATNVEIGVVSKPPGGGGGGVDDLLTFSPTGTPIRFALPGDTKPSELVPSDAGNDLFGRPRKLLGAVPHRPEGGAMGPGSPNFANIGQGGCDPSSGLLGLNLPPLPLLDTVGNVVSGLPTSILAKVPDVLGGITAKLGLNLGDIGGSPSDNGQNGSGGKESGPLGLLNVAGPLGILRGDGGNGGNEKDAGVEEQAGGLPIVGGGLPILGQGETEGGGGIGLLNVAGPLGLLEGAGGGGRQSQRQTGGAPAGKPDPNPSPGSGSGASPLDLLGAQLPSVLDIASSGPLAGRSKSDDVLGRLPIDKLASIPTSHSEPAGLGSGHFSLDQQHQGPTATQPQPLQSEREPVMQPAQSAIWKCDPQGQMSAVWQNPGGARVPTRFFTGGPCANTVCLAVDIQALQAIHGADIEEVKLVAGLL